MRLHKKHVLQSIFSLLLLFVLVIPAQADTATVTVPTGGIPVVSFGAVLGFVIRMFFVVAGIAALMYALIGGLDWVTSQGEKEKIDAAREKITAAIIGIFVLILVLAIMWMLEQVVFNRTLCFGISCDITLPSLGDDGGFGGGGGGSGGGFDCGKPTGVACDDADKLSASFCLNSSKTGKPSGYYRTGYCGVGSNNTCNYGGELHNPNPSDDYYCDRSSTGGEGPVCCIR